MSQEPPHHPLQNNIIQFYNSRAVTYDTEDSFHPTLARDFITWSAPHLPATLATPLKMLDLCCGTGLVAQAARAHYGPQSIIHGIDLSAPSLAIARAKFAPATTATTASTGGDSSGSSNSNSTALGGEALFHEASATALDTLYTTAPDGSTVPLLQKGTYNLITCCSAFVLLSFPVPVPALPVSSHDTTITTTTTPLHSTTASPQATLVATWAPYLAPGGVLILDVPAPDAMLTSLYASRALTLAAGGAQPQPRPPLSLVENREWITGGEALREVFEGAGTTAGTTAMAGMECLEVFLSPVYKERVYAVGDAVGSAAGDVDEKTGTLDAVWERVVGNPLFDVSALTPSQREAAKREFVKMMREEGAREGGVLSDRYQLLVGIGVRR